MISLSTEIEYFHEPFNLEYGPIQQWMEFVPEQSQDYLPFFEANFSKSRKLMKDPLAIFSVKWLERNFDIKPILLIRHPAAFLASFIERGRSPRIEILASQQHLMAVLPNSIQKLFLEYSKNSNLSKVKFCAAVWNTANWFIQDYQQSNPDWMYLRHEDISKNPVRSFKQIFHYSNIQFTPEIKSKILETTGFSGDTNFRSYHRNSKKGIKKWKSILTEKQISEMRELTQEVASHYYSNIDW